MEKAGRLPAELGAEVRRARTEAGLTLKQLADKAGLSSRFVGQLERGRANPSIGTLADLARALDTNLHRLIGSAAGPHHRRLLERVGQLDEQQAGLLLDALERAPRGQAVALLGLRGAGKSTVGRAYAERTNKTFIEVDRQIEAEAGMSLASVFELHGEGHYRELEHRVLQGLLSDAHDPPPVLEVGGGVVTHEDAFSLLKRRAVTVWLKATPQEHWDRVLAQGDSRPMGGRDRARTELQELYERREPLYASAAMTVATTARAVDEVVEELVRLTAIS